MLNLFNLFQYGIAAYHEPEIKIKNTFASYSKCPGFSRSGWLDERQIHSHPHRALRNAVCAKMPKLRQTRNMVERKKPIHLAKACKLTNTAEAKKEY